MRSIAIPIKHRQFTITRPNGTSRIIRPLPTVHSIAKKLRKFQRTFNFIEPPVHPDKTWEGSLQALQLRMDRELEKYEYLTNAEMRSARGMAYHLCNEEKDWVKEIQSNMKILEKEIHRLKSEMGPVKMYLYDVKRFN